MFNASMPSLADIAAVTGNRNGDGDGFGGNNGWWVLIILFALFGGWGRGGYGNQEGGGGSGAGYTATAADVQRGFDNQGVMNKLNGIEQGICSLGYDQLNQMNGINTTVMQTGWGIQNAIQQDSIANMQNTNALSRQLADCCCENRAAIAQVRYDMATNTCATNTAIDKLGDRIDNRITAVLMSQKDEQIAELRSQVNSLNLAQSQANQNQYLISQLRPCPIPAYQTCNPWANQAPYGSCCSNNGGCCN